MSIPYLESEQFKLYKVYTAENTRHYPYEEVGDCSSSSSMSVLVYATTGEEAYQKVAARYKLYPPCIDGREGSPTFDQPLWPTPIKFDADNISTRMWD